MVKRISLIIFSLAIVYIGVVGFNNLRYWERSVWIFETQGEQAPRRGGDRPPPNFDRNSSPERGEQPQQITAPEIDDAGETEITEGEVAPPQNQRERSVNTPERPENIRENRESVEQAPNENRGGRGNTRGRNNSDIRLANVGRFLAVFALFTVVTVYLDKGMKTLFKKKQ